MRRQIFRAADQWHLVARFRAERARLGPPLPAHSTLIAAVVLQLATGRRPIKRTLELLRRYQLGWATLEELTAGLAREPARVRLRAAKKS